VLCGRPQVSVIDLQELLGQGAQRVLAPLLHDGPGTLPPDVDVLGDRLLPEYFRFKRDIQGDLEGRSHLEQNLFDPMAWIVTASHPLLTAAQVNTQVEFDRTFRTIVREHGYQGKRVLYVSGLNIDISPQPGQRFPLTKFVPWAAFVQQPEGSQDTWEQVELLARLREQPSANPDQIDLEGVIHQMEQTQEVRVEAS